MSIHPARSYSFDELVAGLDERRASGMVNLRECPAGRTLYIYTNKCVYDNGWNEFSLLARGLILDHHSKQIVATPFPKFFNAGERNGSIPDLPFEVFEKVDGSLGILHHFNGAWRAATKGAFDSAQAAWIEAQIARQDLSALTPGCTYLVEAIYPENRIVVHYGKAELVLLAAYDEAGVEFRFEQINGLAETLGWRAAERHPYSSFSELVEAAKALPATAEGFVIRFSNGLRLKLKGEEYRRIHALISNCTPLAMWGAMQAGDDLRAIRRELPEEFWTDFDAITSLLALRVADIKRKVAHTADVLAGLPDKEVGLRLRSLEPEVQPLIFHWRKAGGKLEGRALVALYRMIRPTGNILAGYTPSYAMNRVTEEAA